MAGIRLSKVLDNGGKLCGAGVGLRLPQALLPSPFGSVAETYALVTGCVEENDTSHLAAFRPDLLSGRT